MAAGDFTVFNQFKQDILDKVHDCDADSFKIGLITSTITPTAADATPAWGVSSGVDYDGNEVSPIGTSYATGGVVVSTNFTTSLATGNGEWDPGAGPHLNLAQDAGGPTNIRWGILFNETATNNEAVGFIDFGSVISLVDGDITYTFDATAILRIS